MERATAFVRLEFEGASQNWPVRITGMMFATGDGLCRRGTFRKRLFCKIYRNYSTYLALQMLGICEKQTLPVKVILLENSISFCKRLKGRIWVTYSMTSRLTVLQTVRHLVEPLTMRKVIMLER